MKTTKKQNGIPEQLPPYLQNKHTEWVALIKEMHLEHNFERCRFTQKSPSFEFRNWRVNVEHRAEFNSVVLRWLGPKDGCPRGRPAWADVSLSDAKQGWSYRRPARPDDFRTLLLELEGSA
jgi:hypothetical protein